MAGLDCIAMAISHLEREQELSDDSGSPQKMNTTSSPVSQEAPPSMPPRSTFDNTPRLVSSDSMGYEDRSVLHSRPNNAPAPVAGQGTCIPAVVEGMSPDAITRLVDGLSQDKEIHGPPPAPPTPTEVITEVKDCDVLCGRGGETK